MTDAVSSDGLRPAGPSSLPLRAVLLAAFGALILARLPQVLVSPRFFEEEGQFFFAYGWHMPAWAALWHVFGGYLNLPANATTLLAAALVRAGWLPLEDAPYVTEAAGFLFQLCPAILLLWSRAEWLKPRWAAPAALLTVALAPDAEEVWLHSLHIQFHLGLAAAVVLATDADVGAGLRVFRRALLLLGPLSGPPAILLLPLFAARALLDRDRNRGLELAALAFGAAVQIADFAGGTGSRALTISPAMLANVALVRQVVAPLAGPHAAFALGKTLLGWQEAGDWRFGLLAALTAAAFAGLAVLALRRPRHGASWLLAAAALAAAASYVGGLGRGPDFLAVAYAERYSFLPNALLPMAVVAALATASGALARALAALFGWWTLMAALAFQAPLASIAHGPEWRAEVAAWRLDPEHRLASWPTPRLVDLSPDAPPCPGDAAHPPDYCEGYWELYDDHPSVRRP